MSTADEARAALATLTRKQRQAAVLAAHGLTSAEIGERLHRSPLTVRGHLRSVHKALGINRIAQLAVLCTLAGEIDDWRGAA